VTAPQTRVARVCALLNAADARYVVVGATAMQLWGSSRATRDIDVLIEPTIGNAARVLEALAALPFGVAREILPEELVRRGVTMIGDTPNVDVLTRAWNVRWDDASRDIAVFEVEGVPIPTVSLHALIASKRTGRAQDVADIEILEAIRAARLANDSDG
jgi:hypothetical protein